jgi:phosphoribosylanthranilate isomerase
LEQIERLYRSNGVSIAQLHGREDEAYIGDLLRRGVPVIRAVRVKSSEDVLKWQQTKADFLLLDSGGGTGKIFDWRLIPELGRPYFLAGGISEGNIDEALSLKPYCIDVSSGAETDGVKDREKINQLVQKVR